MDWCLYSIHVGRCLFSFLFHFMKTRPVGPFALFSISFALSFGIVLTPVTRRLVYFSLPLSHILYIFLLSFRSTNGSRQNKISEAERHKKKERRRHRTELNEWTSTQIMASEVKRTYEIHGAHCRLLPYYTLHSAHDTHCIYAMQFECVRIESQNLDTHAFPHVYCVSKIVWRSHSNRAQTTFATWTNRIEAK